VGLRAVLVAVVLSGLSFECYILMVCTCTDIFNSGAALVHCLSWCVVGHVFFNYVHPSPVLVRSWCS
jgi:hypothetical protein